MHIISAIILIIALAVAPAACGERNAVTGTITFDGEQAIPEGAVMEVQLRDVSYQDAAAPLIASQTIKEPETLPRRLRRALRARRHRPSRDLRPAGQGHPS